MPETLTLQTSHGDIPLYISQPGSAGPWPGVLVIHEIFGLNDDIRSIADRFAANGYFAVAPDLTCGGRIPCMFRAMQALTRASGPPLDQARAALRWLVEHEQVDSGRAGIAGFCMGGGFALLLGAEGVARAVADNYGAAPQADQTIEKLCPVVASYGDKDPLHKQGKRLQTILDAAGIDHDVRVYPGVGHSFLNHIESPLIKFGSMLGLVGYDEDAAEDTWTRMLAFFTEYV